MFLHLNKTGCENQSCCSKKVLFYSIQNLHLFSLSFPKWCWLIIKCDCRKLVTNWTLSIPTNKCFLNWHKILTDRNIVRKGKGEQNICLVRKPRSNYTQNRQSRTVIQSCHWVTEKFPNPLQSSSKFCFFSHTSLRLMAVMTLV